jgi:hypothetical protein
MRLVTVNQGRIAFRVTEIRSWARPFPSEHFMHLKHKVIRSVNTRMPIFADERPFDVP